MKDKKKVNRKDILEKINKILDDPIFPPDDVEAVLPIYYSTQIPTDQLSNFYSLLQKVKHFREQLKRKNLDDLEREKIKKKLLKYCSRVRRFVMMYKGIEKNRKK